MDVSIAELERIGRSFSKCPLSGVVCRHLVYWTCARSHICVGIDRGHTTIQEKDRHKDCFKMYFLAGPRMTFVPTVIALLDALATHTGDSCTHKLTVLDLD